MPRYLLFGGDNYYPQGGWNDFKGGFESERDALREAAGWGWDWWHILDTSTGEVTTGETRRSR